MENITYMVPPIKIVNCISKKMYKQISKVIIYMRKNN